MFVLDSTAFLNLNDFRAFDRILTIPEVLEEIFDFYGSSKIASLKIHVTEPSKRALQKITKAAQKTGDIDLLSNTDMKVLALNLEKKATLITDDYDIQNLASFLGMKWKSAIQKGIKNVFRWSNVCPSCGSENTGKECSFCGTVVKKIPRRLFKSSPGETNRKV